MRIRNLLITVAIAAFMAVSLSAEAMENPAPGKGEAKPNQFWWPDQLDLTPLRQHNPESNPFGEAFNYAEEFKKLDLEALSCHPGDRPFRRSDDPVHQLPHRIPGNLNRRSDGVL